MKKLIMIAIVSLGLTSAASAGVSCSEDFFGNYNCTSTGGTGDWRSSTSTDFFGNDNTTVYDNYYNDSYSYSCSTDFFGNYNCN